MPQPIRWGHLRPVYAGPSTLPDPVLADPTGSRECRVAQIGAPPSSESVSGRWLINRPKGILRYSRNIRWFNEAMDLAYEREWECDWRMVIGDGLGHIPPRTCSAIPRPRTRSSGTGGGCLPRSGPGFSTDRSPRAAGGSRSTPAPFYVSEETDSITEWGAAADTTEIREVGGPHAREALKGPGPRSQIGFLSGLHLCRRPPRSIGGPT